MGYEQNGVHGQALHHQQNSFETVTSGSEEYPRTTNPSSVNSSNDRIQAMGMPNGAGYGKTPTDSSGPYGAAANGMQNGGAQHGGMPNGGYASGSPVTPPPRSAPNNPRQRIQLGGSSPDTPTKYDPEEFTPQKGKRKSGLGRLFSKRKAKD